MRIGIFGCGGAIGSRLVDWLLGHSDVRITGADVDHRRVAHQLDHPRFSYFNSDLEQDRSLTEQLVRAADVVVDLVAIGPVQREFDPLRVLTVELQASLRVAESCADAGRPLVQLSGGEIFGLWTKHCGCGAGTAGDPRGARPRTELLATTLQRTDALHAASRRMLERAIAALGEIRDLRYVIVRPFNVLGVRSLTPPCELGGSTDLLSHLVDDLVHSRVLVVPDDGVRSAFVAIDDVVDCIGRVILQTPDFGRSEILNIGNPQNEASIADLAYRLRELYRARHWDRRSPLSEIELVPAGEFPPELVADLTPLPSDLVEIHARLQWRPVRSLDQLTASAVDDFVALHRETVGP